jgi:hypothetical protein
VFADFHNYSVGGRGRHSCGSVYMAVYRERERERERERVGEGNGRPILLSVSVINSSTFLAYSPGRLDCHVLCKLQTDRLINFAFEYEIIRDYKCSLNQ